VRVLVVTNDFPPRVGGINYYIDQIVRRFPPGDVTVFASSWPEAEVFDAGFPQKVVRWSSRTMLPTSAVENRVVEVIGSEKPDVVLFGAAVPLGLMGPAIVKRTGVPYAAFTHGVEVACAIVPGGRTIMRRIGRGASLLTAVSDWTRKIIEPVAHCPAPMHLLPAGIDAETFRPDISDAEIRARHGLDGKPVVCCVSRLVARKGQDQIVRALPAIARKIPEVRFLIVGSGPYEATLRKLARKHAVEDRVIFTGQVSYDDLPLYFRAGDVFAMPCRSRFFGLEVEALGAVFTQASAVGRPCVGGDSGGAPEAVRDGETGLVVNSRSVAGIGRAIIALLEDPALAAKMGEAGAEWVHRELTWEAVAGNLAAMLAEVVEK